MRMKFGDMPIGTIFSEVGSYNPSYQDPDYLWEKIANDDRNNCRRVSSQTISWTSMGSTFEVVELEEVIP